MIRDLCLFYGVDYEDALNRFLGKEDLYISFLNKFVSQNNFAEIQTALNQGDGQAVSLDKGWMLSVAIAPDSRRR